jgi:transcriptional regulator with XRE-family HTH domain
MVWHNDKDSSTTLNASILTTPQWSRARQLNIFPLMKKGGSRPERNLRLGRRLALAREVLRLKQYRFAEEAGLSSTRYNQWETGAVYPPADEAIKLCDKYGLTLDWIYRGRMDCLPTFISDGIRALEAAEAARQPAAKVVVPRPRKSA